ncbi:MAG: 2-hydroxyglutaryl-CoA dehydratase [Actinobacteria bacterium]|nr:2-hydroxyglutaryl-CoA dehydratase [Actinomycetota bacterium]
MYFAGVDIGSITAKAVVLDNDTILSTSLARTGHDSRNAGRMVLEEALGEAGISEEDLAKVIATGYGRLNVDFTDEKVTEITCHARGAHFSLPDVRTVIDLGGQDSKGIAIGDNGKVIDFVMNDKCAAGTGRFLEVMAAALQVDLGDLGSISRESKDPAPISSVCTVFAESEVISRVAEGVLKTDIIAGIHKAIASRIFAMISRIPVNEKIVMTGGVARNSGVVDALEERFKTRIIVPGMPQHMGSLGAAIIARERSNET